MQRTNPSRLQTGLRRLRLDWVLYALLLPTLVYFIIFRVIPIWNMRLVLQLQRPQRLDMGRAQVF